jgi:DNA-binding LacI/PurR family transcriptional regulator
MDEAKLLRQALVNAPQLARLAGVSVHTVRAILARKRTRIYPDTRRKLVAALRQHSATLAALADALADPDARRASQP